MSWIIPVKVPVPDPASNFWGIPVQAPMPYPSAPAKKPKVNSRPTDRCWFYVKYDKEGHVRSIEAKTMGGAVGHRSSHLQFYKRVRTFGNLYIAAKDEMDAFRKAVKFKEAMEGEW